jgi:outer membrane protein, multidrug efflux system
MIGNGYMTNFKTTLICTLLVTALWGCAGAPGSALTPPSDPVPPGYRNASEASANNVPQQWWRMYDDAVLNELVEVTLRDNPYTQVAQLRVLAARARIDAANADRMPQIGGGIGFSNSRTSKNTPLGEVLGNNTISGNKYFEASWQVDLWNRVGHAVEAAQAGVEAEKAYTRMVEQVLSWEVAVYYWRFRLAESEIALLSEIHRRRAEALAVLERRFHHGLISELEPARAQLDLKNAEAEIDDARRRLSHAEHELATLTVRPVRGFSLPRSPGYRLPEVPAISPGVPASILANRPDLAQSTQGLRALLAQKEIADKAFYPSLSLTGNFGFASMELRNLAKSDARQFSLGPIALSLPILDGGRIRANQKIADAHYLAALNEHKVKLLIALREVDDALSDVESYRRQEDLLKTALGSAQRVSSMASARYEKGAVSYLDVAVAERDLASAELKLNRNRLQGLLASTQLVYVLGGGWSAESR